MLLHDKASLRNRILSHKSDFLCRSYQYIKQVFDTQSSEVVKMLAKIMQTLVNRV